ncbi:MAG: MGMT family protein [Phycisphaeraceae bacterium]
MDDRHKPDVLAGRVTDAMSFSERVWAVTARIPRGKVATYGQIARVLGTKGYQAVGMALHCNPWAPEVPCHRVVGSDGRLTGFAGGLAKKRELLAAEGVRCAGDRVNLRQWGVDAGEWRTG